MRIALLGAAGQLASDLATALANHDLTPLDRQSLDICDAQAVDRTLERLRPNAVVNCAAYNLVDQAESEPSVAFAVNAFGPRNVAIACRRIGAILMHFSTDYVFGATGARSQPWMESDPPAPVGVYATSKLAGEFLALGECERCVVVRTCGLYGLKGARGKGGNFVETMLRLAREGKAVRVVADQFCTPSFTADVAVAAAKLLESGRFGVYHVTNSGACSWRELAAEAFRLCSLNVECEPISSSDWKSAARRPPYSVLSNAKLVAAGIDPLPDWRDALKRYLALRSMKPAEAAAAT